MGTECRLDLRALQHLEQDSGGQIPTIEITIRDNDGSILRSTADQPYTLPLEQQTLHEIEGAVERFKQQSFPTSRKRCLKRPKSNLQQIKKQRILFVTGLAGLK